MLNKKKRKLQAQLDKKLKTIKAKQNKSDKIDSNKVEDKKSESQK